MKTPDVNNVSFAKVVTYMEQFRNGNLEQELHVAILGALIADLRLSKGMNREELSEITELPKDLIAQLERGVLPAREIQDLWLASISGALNIQPTRLLVYILRGLPRPPARGIPRAAQKLAPASKAAVHPARPRPVNQLKPRLAG